MLRASLFALATTLLFGIGCQTAETTQSAEFSHGPQPSFDGGYQAAQPQYSPTTRYSSYSGSSQMAPVSRSLQRPCGTYG